jgi:hypothetical protein
MRCATQRDVALVDIEVCTLHSSIRSWSAGALLAVLYITLFLGSLLAGVVYHAGHPDGIAIGYLTALVTGIGIVSLLTHLSRRRTE